MLSHFGPEEIAKTCRLISDLEIPYGGTLGDLIAITDDDCMTKMLVEERVMGPRLDFLWGSPLRGL